MGSLNLGYQPLYPSLTVYVEYECGGSPVKESSFQKNMAERSTFGELSIAKIRKQYEANL